MNVDLLERATVALGSLLPEVTFVGGATVALWLNDAAAAGARPTNDVDVVVELTSRTELHNFDERLRAAGFREDIASGVLCRWNHGPADDVLIVDVMPTESALLGFSNRCQRQAVPHAALMTLPSGAAIQAIPPPYLIATKIEAFHGRGRGDYLASHDLEDVITLVDGCDSLVDQCRRCEHDLQTYIASETGRLLAADGFQDALPGYLRPDLASQQRLELDVLPRLKRLAAIV
jgi:urease beta subunit